MRVQSGNQDFQVRWWPNLWLQADRVARQAMTEQLSALDEPFEGKVFAELSQLLPDHTLLFAGNSMPVRDLDTFFPGSAREIRFLANRGASGIDGVVSSALGASAVCRSRLVLVIGDLSFYHDLNGLLAARQYTLDATVILLNNDGGGIFSFLPQAEHRDQFERLFGTPHGLDYRPAVEMYGGRFESVRTWEDFRDATERSVACSGLSVIELPTERERNRELHGEIMRGVARSLRDHVLQGAPV
jgi:2-succinyl-5-enolpyruvyl-6-hydroxy-3-cyclohexene-1-carboxylate synthase